MFFIQYYINDYVYILHTNEYIWYTAHGGAIYMSDDTQTVEALTAVLNRAGGSMKKLI